MSDSGTKKCPLCRETIKAEAIKCRFCGEFIELPPSSGPVEPAEAPIPEIQREMTAKISGLIFEGSLSKIALLGALMKLFLSVLIAVGICASAIYFPAKLSPEWMSTWDRIKLPVWGVAAGIAIIGMIVFFVRYMTFKNRRYVITADRIESHQGLFSHSVNNIDMWRIKDIEFHQTFPQRILGVGTIVVESTDATHPHILIGPIPGVKKLYARLREAALQADQRRGVLHVEQ